MLYDAKEVVEICKKYGIEMVDGKGAPLYMGKEMDENFSFSEMMHEPVVIKESVWGEISDYMKYIKRKLKLKSEMCVIGSKIRFLKLKYLVCKVKLKAIDCKKCVYLKACDLKDRVLGIYQ